MKKAKTKFQAGIVEVHYPGPDWLYLRNWLYMARLSRPKPSTRRLLRIARAVIQRLAELN